MKRAIIFGIPHHGNLGDNAIAMTEEKFLKENLKGYEIYNVPERNLDKCADKLKKYIQPEDVLFMHGGGNIGDTYERPEKGRRKVIQNFPNNKIIIFPQTAYYSDTELGKKELEISKEIYNNHPDLTMIAREEKSYEFMKKHFTNAKVILTTDIVMYLDKTDDSKKREGAILALRTDREKVFTDTNQIEAENIVKKYHDKISITDTNIRDINNNIFETEREAILDKKFEEFQTAELAITDRLHGMIFAAITSTPCVAFTNFNFKIKESFKWLEHLEYIEFCDDIKDLEDKIKKVKSVKNPRYNNEFAKETLVKMLEDL